MDQERVATSSTHTAIASARRPAIGRPRNTASNEHPAIAHARSTDGSQRVIVPNSNSNDDTGREPPPPGQAPHQRTGQRQHERNVLPRHDEQVRQTGRAELLDDVARQLAGVAHEEARRDRPLGRRERQRAAQDGRPRRVRDDEQDRAGGAEADELGGFERADGVPPTFS